MKQLSVFLENRQGRLGSVLEILSNEGINIVSLSLADTTDFGMLRLIVSDYEKGKAVLKENGFSAHLSDVVGIKLSHTVGSLQKALGILADNNVNIEYMYALCTGTDEAAIVIKPSSLEEAVTVLEKAGYSLFTDGDLLQYK